MRTRPISLCFSGMRPDEIIAPWWSDVDFASGVARVQRVPTFKGSERDETKTRMDRDVELVSPALEALEAMRVATFVKRGDVFENPNTGRPWHDERSQRETFWRRGFGSASGRGAARPRGTPTAPSPP